MSDGFQVTTTDLLQAAGVFRAESGMFAAIMPGSGPASVDAGGAEVNGALSEVLEAIGGLHIQLGAIIGQHAGKLEAAYRTYRDAEDAIVEECQAIAVPSQAGRGPGG